MLTSSPRLPFSKGKQKLWGRVWYHVSPHSPKLIQWPVPSRLAQRKMRITAGLLRKQARASLDKTPGCYPWVLVSCYGARDGCFPRNGVWNPARPRDFEVHELYLRVWQSFHFFADFRPKLFVRKPGKINEGIWLGSFFSYLEFLFKANKVWTVSWRNCNLLRAGREKKFYSWFIDAFLFHLKLIDICVEGVAIHRPAYFG